MKPNMIYIFIMLCTATYIFPPNLFRTTSLLRSENGRLFLVTYNFANKIVSKHQINLQLNAEEDCSELKTSSVVESPTVMNKQAPVMNNIENPYQPATIVNIQKDKAQSGNKSHHTFCCLSININLFF